MKSSRAESHDVGLVSGAWAGLFGGLVLAVIMTAVGMFEGADPWIGAKMAGAPFLAERALRSGFDALAVIVGIVSHFIVSVVWGALFGVLVAGLAEGLVVVAGIAWGIVVWLGMYEVVLPSLGLDQLTAGEPVTTAVLDHVIFGVAVALGFIAVRQRRATRRLEPGIATRPPDSRARDSAA
jgi:hypothetical protein